VTSRVWRSTPIGHTPITAAWLNGIEADLDARPDRAEIDTNYLPRSEYVPGGGGGTGTGGNVYSDSEHPGLYYIATSGTITPDTANPGLYLIGA
jgi:hypothetical protein